MKLHSTPFQPPVIICPITLPFCKSISHKTNTVATSANSSLSYNFYSLSTPSKLKISDSTNIFRKTKATLQFYFYSKIELHLNSKYLILNFSKLKTTYSANKLNVITILLKYESKQAFLLKVWCQRPLEVWYHSWFQVWKTYDIEPHTPILTQNVWLSHFGDTFQNYRTDAPFQPSAAVRPNLMLTMV